MEYTTKINFNHAFQKIVTYYLLESPAKQASHRGKSLKDRGFEKHLLTKLLHQMKEVAGEDFKKNFSASDNLSGLDKNKNKRAYKGRSHQYCLISNTNARAEVILKTIRNSLAHGSFITNVNKGETYYLFENVNKGKFKGRICVTEKTLLAWITVIDAGPQHKNY